MTEPERFFSHRGQKGLTGRMVAVIGVAGVR
jgi:copper oxidase (laccase) domain-containing protein